MRISDEIERFIKDMLYDNNEIEIQRNALAQKFNCVPSQINYVISTRFKPLQGYYVESRRGGGGSIIIKQVVLDDRDIIFEFINKVGRSFSQREAEIMLSDLVSCEILDEEQARILRIATSDKVLQLEQPTLDELRARLFKNILINLDTIDVSDI